MSTYYIPGLIWDNKFYLGREGRHSLRVLGDSWVWESNLGIPLAKHLLYPISIIFLA